MDWLTLWDDLHYPGRRRTLRAAFCGLGLHWRVTLAIATQRVLAGLGADPTSSDGRPKAELAYGFAALTLRDGV